ncbi:hypothetical protein BD410DRAFT_286384 [Rickenella mellea]|uniref:Uncharacterized protein n=1 Tax=Rickenella mellea TaxID=50990 RepID=A0A4Y7Q1X3_9AGAM|nr:hypothetical protein BD410DRAFT_286384 [Rickenella mellea]
MQAHSGSGFSFTIRSFDRTGTDCTPSTLYTVLIKNILVLARRPPKLLPHPMFLTRLTHSQRDRPTRYPVLIFVAYLFTFTLSLFVNLKRTSSLHVRVRESTVSIIQLAFVDLAVPRAEILTMIATERMILANNVGSAEGRRTFGQAIALVVALVPIWSVVGQMSVMRVERGCDHRDSHERKGRRSRDLDAPTLQDCPYQMHNHVWNDHQPPLYLLFTKPPLFTPRRIFFLPLTP